MWSSVLRNDRLVSAICSLYQQCRGSWGVDAEKIKSMAACVACCTACSRCNYVSLSLAPAHAECAWYAACDMAHLTAPPESGTDYETVHVVKMR